MGYQGSPSWGKLGLSGEGERAIDLGDSSGSFFSNGSELTFAPVKRLRFGLVTRRRRAYDMDPDIQRELLFGFSWELWFLFSLVLAESRWGRST